MFLSLASNGLRVLRSLGVLKRVQRAGFDVPGQRMWSSSGKLLGDVPRGRMRGDELHSVTLMHRVIRSSSIGLGFLGVARCHGRVADEWRLSACHAVG